MVGEVIERNKLLTGQKVCNKAECKFDNKAVKHTSPAYPNQSHSFAK